LTLAAHEAGFFEEKGPVIEAIDDSDAQRRAIRRLLGDKGYRLIEASNGVAGLEVASAYCPEIVLLDVQMPDMDGYEVCRRLRADPRTSETVIIMITASADRESLRRGIEAGADDFLTKPVDGLELKTRVANIVRLGRYRRLVRERAKFEWVADHADAGYILLAESGAITYANRRAREYLGLAEGAPGPMPGFLDIVSREYVRRPEDAWANWPETSESPRFLLRPETRDYRALWLEVKVDALPPGGTNERLIQVADVTERMESHRMRATFESLVSHKLRTPLTALIGGLGLLDGLNLEMPRETIKGVLKVVRDGGERLRDEIQEVISYLDAPVRDRRGEGLAGDEFVAVATAAAADDGVSLVEIAVEPAVKSARIALSRAAMETVFAQLFSNARKFHPAGAPNMSISFALAPDRSACRLRVRDDGPGLPVEELKKVLTPYYQYEKSFTGQVKGMGLGLSTVASLAWSAGGECRLRNVETGSGLEVELIIPLAGAD
jgi:CheY-like chemotaxis protein